MGRHKKNCTCFVCQQKREGTSAEQAQESLARWEEGQLAKRGWYIHFVTQFHQDQDKNHGMINAHTHGLEKWDHLDLQIVCPLAEETVGGTFRNIIERIKEGERYKHEDILEGILGGGYLIKLVEAVESGRLVLRAIIPDEEGHFDKEDLKEPWVHQYEGVYQEGEGNYA